MANADFGVDSGGGALSAGADVDFQIIIPRFIYFQVGDAIAGAESVNFDMTGVEDQIGNSVAQAGTGGNLGGGAVDVVVRGNAGDMTITETNSTTNGLEDGGPGKAIDLGEINNHRRRRGGRSNSLERVQQHQRGDRGWRYRQYFGHLDLHLRQHHDTVRRYLHQHRDLHRLGPVDRALAMR